MDSHCTAAAGFWCPPRRVPFLLRVWGADRCERRGGGRGKGDVEKTGEKERKEILEITKRPKLFRSL